MSVSYEQAYRANLKICQALGLDATLVQAVTIEMRAGAWPTVLVERWVMGEEGLALAEVIEEFCLIPTEDAS
jgi:hypothetical protein